MVNNASRARAKLAELAHAKDFVGKPPTVVDASGAIVGRLASHLAKRLIRGEAIIVVNAEKALVTGSPPAVKARYHFKTHVGTRRKGPFPSRMPHLLLKRSVRGMLPYQLPHGRAAIKRLTCHIGVPPDVKGTPERIEAAIKPVERAMTLAQVSEFLGKPIEVKTGG